LFVARLHPAVAPYLERPGSGQEYIDQLRPADQDGVQDMTRCHQGAEQASLVTYWMDRQPQAFRVFRRPGSEIIGYLAVLALHEASQADLDTDPGARAMWDYACRHGPPRPGEEVCGWRFFLDKDHHHQPSTSLALLSVWSVEQFMSQRGCSWELAGTYQDPAAWEPIMAYMDFHRAPEADYRIGGQRYVVFAHDWRRVDLQQWLELTADRELGTPSDPTTAPPPLLVMSQPEFNDAVRAALRDFHDEARLAASPLLQSRLVRDEAGGEPGPDVLRRLLDQAAETLRTDPRREDLFRTVQLTFLRPAPTQERAAEQLHLSFSTYRRYRDRAVALMTEWLWQRELYGLDSGSSPASPGGR